jgi:hypothetical protein
VKRGYISPNEVDDVRAVEQAMNLFVWDELEKLGKRVRETATKPVALVLQLPAEPKTVSDGEAQRRATYVGRHFAGRLHDRHPTPGGHSVIGMQSSALTTSAFALAQTHKHYRSGSARTK